MKWSSPIYLLAFAGAAMPIVCEEARAQAKVGEVIIVGNTHRPDADIRQYVNIYPGQVLDYAELKRSEDALADSGLCRVDAAAGVRPTILILDSPGQFKDILVKVEDLPPTLIEHYACPAMLAAIVLMMTLLAVGSVWRHYRRRRAE